MKIRLESLLFMYSLLLSQPAVTSVDLVLRPGNVVNSVYPPPGYPPENRVNQKEGGGSEEEEEEREDGVQFFSQGEDKAINMKASTYDIGAYGRFAADDGSPLYNGATQDDTINNVDGVTEIPSKTNVVKKINDISSMQADLLASSYTQLNPVDADASIRKIVNRYSSEESRDIETSEMTKGEKPDLPFLRDEMRPRLSYTDS